MKEELSSFEELFLAVNDSIRNTTLMIVAPIMGIVAVMYTLQLMDYDGIPEEVPFSLLVLAFGLIGMAIWQYQKIKKNIHLLNKVIRERYLENFLYAKPIGDTPIEKLLSILKDIFPQVKIALNENNELEELDNISWKLKTKYKDIIIKEIQTEISLDELVEIIKKTNITKIGRLVILCHEVTSIIENENYENMMNKIGTKVDLILFKNNSFELCWISNKVN